MSKGTYLDSGDIVAAAMCKDITTITAADLTSLATCRSLVVRQAIANNPNTPPAVKLWLKNGYGQMTLEEFLNAVDSGD